MRVGIGSVVLAVFAIGCGSTPVEVPETPTSQQEVATPDWSIEPVAIRFDSSTSTVFVQVAIDVQLNGAPPREKEAYLGVTLAAEDGEEFDLAIQSVFPSQLDQPLLFSAGVEKPIQDVLVGLWDHKVQPCDSERPGCKEYGFLLDGSLASWPPNLYVDYKRQRILPAEVSLQWIGTAGEQATLQQAVGGFLKTQLEVFGATLQIATADQPTTETPQQTTVFFKHSKDEVLASQLGAVIAKESRQSNVVWTRDEALATDFAVQFVGSR